MAAIPPPLVGEISINRTNKERADARSLNPKPPPTMNHSQSHPQPSPESDDELRIRDYAVATALIVGACASVAITFTAIATCYAVDDVIQRIFKKGGRHVPR
jgi:hypothetical protein